MNDAGVAAGDIGRGCADVMLLLRLTGIGGAFRHHRDREENDDN